MYFLKLSQNGTHVPVLTKCLLSAYQKNGTWCIPVLEKNGPNNSFGRMGKKNGSTLGIVPCTVYRVPCTVYRVPCILYRVQCTVYRVPCTVYCVHDACRFRSQINSFVWSMFFKQDSQLSLVQRSALVVEQVNHHFINCVVFACFVLWKCFCPHLLKLWAWNRNSVQMIVGDQRSVRHARGTSLCQAVVFLNKWMARATHFGDVQTDVQTDEMTCKLTEIIPGYPAGYLFYFKVLVIFFMDFPNMTWYDRGYIIYRKYP